MKRAIFGQIRKLTDDLWVNAKGQILLVGGSYTDNIQYPSTKINYITDSQGFIKADDGTDLFLWCNEEGSINSHYTFFLPDGNKFDFTVPVGTEPIKLVILRENLNETEPQYQSIVNYVDLQIAGVVAGNTTKIYSPQITAPINLSALRVVSLRNAQYTSILSSSDTHTPMGFTELAVTSGQLFRPIVYGVVSDSSWNWNLNNPVFLSTNGNLTQSIGLTDLFIKQVATVISPTSLLIDFKDSINLTL